MEDSPVNAAHVFANAAEEFEEKEQWGKAMEAHFRAAEQFLLAMNYTSDPEAIKTLKLLYANHTRQGKELQRRVSKQHQESPRQRQEHSSSVSQPSSSPSPSTTSYRSKTRTASPSLSSSPVQAQASSSTSSARKSSSAAHHLHQQQQSHLQKLQQTSRLSPLVPKDNYNTNYHANGYDSRTHRSEAHDRTESPPAFGVPRDTLESSSTSIEGSYTMLKGNSDLNDDDESDPFNKFWQIVESLVSKVSNPIAFATVPLHSADPLNNTLNNKKDIGGAKGDDLASGTLGSFYIVPTDRKPNNNNISQPISENKNILPSSSKTIEEYAIENQQLKAIIDNMSKRMMDCEKAAEENSMLKSSILQFKTDVEKQAKRIRLSQEMSKPSLMVRQISPESSSMTNVGALQRRIRELEEELRTVKSENEKMLERWKKLKESARKKRSEKHAEAISPPPTSAMMSPKKALTIIPNCDLKYRDDSRSSSPTYPRPPQSPQLPPSPSSRASTPTSSSMSQPASPTIFGFQKRLSTSILDSTLSAKGNSIVFNARERTPVPPTTTIVHATGSPSKTIHSRSNSIGSSDSPTALSRPELKRQSSLGSLMLPPMTVASVTPTPGPYFKAL